MMGILCIALKKSASGELQRELDQKQREIDFHETVQDLLMLNPAHLSCRIVFGRSINGIISERPTKIRRPQEGCA